MIVDQAEKSATQVIRAALHARRSALAGIARDAGVSTETLHLFLSGSGLAPNILEALTTRIWGGAFRFDPATDTMRSTNILKPTTVNTDCRAKLVIGNPPRGGITRLGGDAKPPPPAKPAWLR